MNKLKQRKNFSTREFRLAESKLYCTSSRLTESTEVDIPFENIEGDKVSHRTSNGFLLASSITLFFVAFLTYAYSSSDFSLVLFWLALGTILLILHYFSRNNFWKLKLSNGGHFFVHKKIPNETEVNQFIDKLIESRNNYLRENYFLLDENLDYNSQLTNLRWLKTINVISKSEFDNKYNELKRTVKPDKKDIGF